MQPRLRLVGSPIDNHKPRGVPGRSDDQAVSSAQPVHSQLPGRDAEQVFINHGGPVARENHHAAGLSSDDVRWIFAASVLANLEHGQAAVLTPERRRLLLDRARLLRIRPFDASMVIALVQDEARRTPGKMRTLSAGVIDRLKVIDAPHTMTEIEHDHSGNRTAWSQLLAAMVLGAILMWLMIRAVGGLG